MAYAGGLRGNIEEFQAMAANLSNTAAEIDASAKNILEDDPNDWESKFNSLLESIIMLSSQANTATAQMESIKAAWLDRL